MNILVVYMNVYNLKHIRLTLMHIWLAFLGTYQPIFRFKWNILKVHAEIQFWIEAYCVEYGNKLKGGKSIKNCVQ